MSEDSEYERRLEAAIEARERAYRQLGTLDPYIMGAGVEQPPYWPSRRAYQHITGPGYFAIATLGMSDPWRETNEPGFGVEFFIEVAEPHAQDAWVFSTILRVAEMVVTRNPSFSKNLDEHEVLSFELAGEGFPDDWRAPSGRVGLLFGVAPEGIPKSFDNADGKVRVVAITLIRPGELTAIIEGGPTARMAIAHELASKPRGHANRLDRPALAIADEYPVEPYVGSGARENQEASPEPKKPWWKFWA